MPKALKPTVPSRAIEHHIYTARELKVMLDADLAALYGVQTKMLNRADNASKTVAQTCD